jgi:hypothetical protein
MFWNGKEYCDHCHLPLLDDDKTTVKIPKDGATHVFHFHNRQATPPDCLALKLLELKQKFETQSSQHTPAPSR